MQKKLPFLLLILLAFACGKKSQTSACGTQVCTALFAEINVKFVDTTGTPVAVRDVTVTDLRTNSLVIASAAQSIPGDYDIADDGNIKSFSADGDDLQVKATEAATGEVKTFTVKVSGGACACHVSKVSGPDTVTFN